MAEAVAVSTRLQAAAVEEGDLNGVAEVAASATVEGDFREDVAAEVDEAVGLLQAVVLRRGLNAGQKMPLMVPQVKRSCKLAPRLQPQLMRLQQVQQHRLL